MSAHRRTPPDDAVPDPTRPGTPGLDPVPEPPPGPGGRATRRTLRVVAVAVLTVVGCAGWYGHRQWDAQAAEALTRADTDLRVAAAELRAARTDGQTVLAGSTGRVADNAVRRELAALLVGAPPTTTDDAASRSDRTAQAHERAEAVTERVALLVGATGTVRAEQADWELTTATADHAAAVAALAGAVDEATEVLAASEGRVLDDAVRIALAETLDAAGVVRDAAAPSGTATLAAAAAEARALVEQLAHAQGAVAEAEATWQAEQDRLAAEQAAARAGGPGSRGSGSSGSGSSGSGRSGSSGSAGSGSSGRASGGAGGSSSGTSGGKTAGSPGGTGWLQGWEPGDPVPDGYQVVVESEGGGWGGDEHGNVWVH